MRKRLLQLTFITPPGVLIEFLNTLMLLCSASQLWTSMAIHKMISQRFVLFIAGAPPNVTNQCEVLSLRLTDGAFCSDFPCQNRGSCINNPGSFFCECAKGFTGLRCEQNINECVSFPCPMDCVCIDTVGSFECQCAENNACASNPCGRNCTCFDQENGYACRCPSNDPSQMSSSGKFINILFPLTKLSETVLLGMARNEISSLIMSLLEAISVQFNDILHNINDKITRDFSILCLTNSLKCQAFFCTWHY